MNLLCLVRRSFRILSNLLAISFVSCILLSFLYESILLEELNTASSAGNTLDNMAALNYPVVGVPKQTPAPADGKYHHLSPIAELIWNIGSVGVRRELRDLKTNYPDQFTLYILGLQALMNRPATSDLSYYGIAGNSLFQIYPEISSADSEGRNPWQTLSILGRFQTEQSIWLAGLLHALLHPLCALASTISSSFRGECSCIVIRSLLTSCSKTFTRR